MFIPLRIKSQFIAAIIATLLLPTPTEAVPPKIPFCVWGEQTIRQVDDFTIICRNLVPKAFSQKAIDEISLYRFNGRDLETAIKIVVYSYGLKLVSIGAYRVPYASGVDPKITQFWLKDRKFDEWAQAGNANPDLLEQRRNDVTLLLDTLEASPPNRPNF